jgi:hypothetical protein
VFALPAMLSQSTYRLPLFGDAVLWSSAMRAADGVGAGAVQLFTRVELAVVAAIGNNWPNHETLQLAVAPQLHD